MIVFIFFLSSQRIGNHAQLLAFVMTYATENWKKKKTEPSNALYFSVQIFALNITVSLHLTTECRC
jgi:hypothetical protein